MDKKNLIMAFSLVFEVGFLLAIPVVVLLFGGLWLDKELHTLPLFTCVGVIVGFTGGIINTYRAVQKLTQRKK